MSAPRKRFTGVAWVNQPDWFTLRSLFLDPNALPETFERWREKTMSEIRDLEDRGFIVQKIPILPEDYVHWCRFRGLRPSCSSMRLFVAKSIELTPDARRKDGRRRPRNKNNDKGNGVVNGGHSVSPTVTLRADPASLMPV